MPVLVAIFLGLGVGTGAPVCFTTVGDLFEGSYLGTIMGTVVLGFSLGGVIGAWLAGFLHDQTNSYFTTFLTLLGALIVSMVLMMLIAPRNIRPVHDKTRAPTKARLREKRS
jgi:MFS family permease